MGREKVGRLERSSRIGELGEGGIERERYKRGMRGYIEKKGQMKSKEYISNKK